MEKKKMQILAFHLPQYHSFPENDEWWGKGFTEWVNVRNANSMFDGHNQPRVPYRGNYYNMCSINTLREQCNLASKYGIDGFCYYHYWFNGKKLMEQPVELLLRAREIPQRFCFCWANEPWTRSWDGKSGCVLIDQLYGGKREWEQHYQYLLPFFKDERYIKVENKPILVIYRANTIEKYDQMITYFKQQSKENGFDGLYVIEECNYYQDRKISDISDALVHFEPMHSLQNGRHILEKVTQRLKSEYLDVKNGNKIRYYDYDKVWKRLIREFQKSKEYVLPGAFVDWDNTPRRKENGMVFINGNPDKFGKYLEKLMTVAQARNKNFLFINAWNEWAEGTYLEPDEKYGFAYLQKVKYVKDRIEGAKL